MNGDLGASKNGGIFCNGFLTSRGKSKLIIISCFAMDNYLWLRKYGPNAPSYELSEWVDLNRGTQIAAVRELISTVV